MACGVGARSAARRWLPGGAEPAAKWKEVGNICSSTLRHHLPPAQDFACGLIMAIDLFLNFRTGIFYSCQGQVQLAR